MTGAEPALKLAEGLEGPTGQPVRIHLADGRELSCTPMLVPLSRLIPSHNPHSWAKQPTYPRAVQERRYHADPGAQRHVDQIARQLDPKLLLRIQLRAIDGPPVVRPDGIVIGGNGRTMAMQRAQAQYPEAWRRYVEALPQMCKLQGLPDRPRDEETVLALVIRGERSALQDPIALADLAAALNDVPTKSRDPLGEAATRARRFTQDEDLVDWFQQAFDGLDTLRRFLRKSNGRAFVRRLIRRGVFLQTEVSKLIDNHGGLTDDAIGQVERMLYAAAVDDPDIVDRAPARAKNRIEHAVPAIVRCASYDGWDIRGPVRQGLEILAGVRSTAASCTAEFLSQIDVFDRTFDPRGMEVAELIEETSKHDLKERFRKYSQMALEAHNREENMELWDWEPPSPKETFRALLSPDGPGRMPGRQFKVPSPEELERADDQLVRKLRRYWYEVERLDRDLELNPEMAFNTVSARKIWVSRRRRAARERAAELGVSDEKMDALLEAVKATNGGWTPEDSTGGDR